MVAPMEPSIQADLDRISFKIRELFVEKYNNYRTLSNHTGIAVNTLKSVMQGKRANIYQYLKVCEVLGVSLVEICKQLDTPEPLQTEEQDLGTPVEIESTVPDIDEQG